MIYRIIENFDINMIGSSNHIYQVNNFTICYKLQQGMGNTKTLATIYKDPNSDACLVGAEPDIMDNIEAEKLTLQEHINNGGSWSYFRCDGYDDNLDDRVIFSNTVIKLDTITPDISTLNPQEISNKRYIVGRKPTVPMQLGCFNPFEIEQDVYWVGQKAEDISII